MIQFERIKVKNFLSYGNAWSEIDLNLGKALVVAENGAGKCVDPAATMIDVQFANDATKALFLDFISKSDKQ